VQYHYSNKSLGGTGFSITTVLTLQEFSITLSGNVSEMLAYFRMPFIYTVDDVSAKSVVLETSSSEKMQFTVMLTELAVSMKVPKYVILNHKTM
jgi:hypothetical protein